MEYITPLPMKTERSPVYLTLLLMNNLRTLTLTNCLNLPSAFALNPNQNPSRTVVCPKLEELVLHTMDKDKDLACVNELLEAVKERASSGSKLAMRATGSFGRPFYRLPFVETSLSFTAPVIRYTGLYH